jgi:2-polyprenyl-6-methoxyphenol hydroxylase-like FAD-dependent oxidoreductase
VKAIIIGGGIAGLTTAIALRKVGLDAEVYERAPELREVGAGIGLGANAVKSLRHLGLDVPVLAAGDSWRCAELRSWRGRVLLSEDFTRHEGILGACATVIHRADLLDILLAALPGEAVRFGHEFTDYTLTATGVKARFANGASAAGDLLIGADGLFSEVRAQMLGPAPPRYRGHTCWRAVVPFPYERIPPGYICEVWGRGARFGIVRTGGERIYWFATLNTPALDPAAPLPPQKSFLERTFGGWAAPVPELVALTPEAAILRNDIFDRPPGRRWFEGRVLLIGDAAHPTTPNLGQGGGMAIEDALVLARLLRNSSDIPAALEAFTRERYQRTAVITRESRCFGQIAQWQTPWLCALRDSLLGAAPRGLAIAGMLRHHRFDPGPP